VISQLTISLTPGFIPSSSSPDVSGRPSSAMTVPPPAS
jgi:hypothetical protein